jgi:hypothetical protein
MANGYIDIAYLYKRMPVLKDTNGDYLIAVSDIRTAIAMAAAETGDVVEVVRCKDCKHFGKDMGYGKHDCKKYEMPYCLENDFCSYGVRKEQT